MYSRCTAQKDESSSLFCLLTSSVTSPEMHLLMFIFSLFKLPCMSYSFEHMCVHVCTVKYVNVWILSPDDVKYMVILKEINNSIRNLIESQESSALHFTTINIVPSTYGFVKSTAFSFIYTASAQETFSRNRPQTWNSWMDVWTSLCRNIYFSGPKMRKKSNFVLFLSKNVCENNRALLHKSGN